MNTVSLRDRLKQTAWLVLFAAMSAGLLDLLVIAGKKLAFGRWAYLGPQVVWMSPLSYLIVFAVLALVWLVLGALVRIIAAPWILAFVLILLAVAGPLTIAHPWLATWAIALLSLGVAIRVAATARGKPEAFLVFARRCSPVLLGLVVLLAVAVNLRGLWRSRRAEQALPAAPAQGAPNVLLVVLDAVRAPALSAYGHPQPTSPHLERLAARGVRFERAFSPAPWTIPTHASYFTGRAPHELAADWDSPLDTRDSTLGEIFRARGWRAAGFTGNTAMMIGESGLGRGFDPYDYQHVSCTNILYHGGLVRFVVKNRIVRRIFNDYRLLERRWGVRVVNEFLGWHRGHRDRPFFALVNIYDAHEPYTAPRELQQRFAPDVRWPGLIERIKNRGQPTRLTFHPSDSTDQRALYHASVAQADAALGMLLDSLEARGVLDSTVVITVADHGEEFYKHGEWGHSQTLYHMALRVPLVMAGPGVPAGVVVPTPVEARHLTTTALDLARVQRPPISGPLLSRYWVQPGAAGDTVVSSRTAPPVMARPEHAPRAWSLVAGDLHYIRELNRTEHLYDYVTDPFEVSDLAADTAFADELSAFRRFVSALERP